MKKLTFILIMFVMLSSCDSSNSQQKNENNLRRFLAKYPVSTSNAYMVIKNSYGVKSWLITVHGYYDNQKVCEEIIKPYNENPKLSTINGVYSCQPVSIK